MSGYYIEIINASKTQLMNSLSKNYDLATLRMLANILKVSGDLILVKYQQFVIDKIDYYIVQHRELVHVESEMLSVNKDSLVTQNESQEDIDVPSKKKRLFSFRNSKVEDGEQNVNPVP